ncbi:hypothetical protein CABS01_00181 [Colletotrichum abscissum]|uniref:uncharacterized protein n=1 Tax=Colletotrichum abscissum TaxID=1671311 RepID=UPI0027D4A1EB|nr:uncharacterized protein CABS01_00181 [Colletotrichum abscissum]KAK1525092.1 hypothetical protein CABS01_00181 [Colletotrichum abscissum]
MFCAADIHFILLFSFVLSSLLILRLLVDLYSFLSPAFVMRCFLSLLSFASLCSDTLFDIQIAVFAYPGIYVYSDLIICRVNLSWHERIVWETDAHHGWLGCVLSRQENQQAWLNQRRGRKRCGDGS